MVMDPAEYARWDRGTTRGIGKRRFVGTEQDPTTGQPINVYELVDDEWNDEKIQESELHLRLHKFTYVATCHYCNLRLRGEHG